MTRQPKSHPWMTRAGFVPKRGRKDSRVWLRMSGARPIITVRVGNTRTYRRFVVDRVSPKETP